MAIVNQNFIVMKYWSDPWPNEPEQRKREKKIKISTRRRGRGGRGEGGCRGRVSRESIEERDGHTHGHEY